MLTRLGRIDSTRIPEVLELVELSDRANDFVRSYSLGMKQRLGVAAALLPNPELCILDEPTNGLDPAGIREMRSVIRGLADRGISVFVSSHLLAEIEAICDHLVMIDSGRIVFQGGVDKLIAAQQAEIVATPSTPPTRRHWPRYASPPASSRASPATTSTSRRPRTGLRS